MIAGVITCEASSTFDTSDPNNAPMIKNRIIVKNKRLERKIRSYKIIHLK